MTPLDIPPGVMHKRVKATKSSNWRETNLIRWEENTLLPVGGWEKLTFNTVIAARIRKIHQWMDNTAVAHTAYLCETKVYVETAGVLTDISPTVPLVDPYTGSYEQGGYGDGLYNASTYGTPRDVRPRIRPYTPSYSIGNWGQELRVMTSSDGRYLGWDPSTPATPCTAIVGAPINNRGFVITPERHVIIWGVDGDFNNTGWCSREDDTDWDFADPLNTAGELPVEPKSPIVTGVMVGSDLLFFTADGRAFAMRYIGTPYIYKHDPLGECSVPYSADSITALPIGASWFTASGFWTYNGTDVAPMPCEVWDWIGKDISDFYTRYESTCINLRNKQEAWFFFVGADEQYNTRFVMLDYREGYIWSMGTLSRSAGFSFPNADNPLMADGATVYRHEVGLAYDDYDLFPFAETFLINAESGTVKTTIRKMLPEVDGDHSVLRYSVMKQNKRIKGSETQSALRQMRDNGYVDIRETARDLRLRIEAIAEPTEIWSIGQIAADLVSRGEQ